jgi:hypothetical protein
MGFLASANAASKGTGKVDVPRYTAAAEATAKGSRPNWSGPAGGQTWKMDPNTNEWTMQVTSPNQGTFDALSPAMQSAASMDPSQARDAAVKQNQDYGMSLLNPQLQQQNSQFNAQSANTGLEPGTEAYNNANLALGQKQASAIAGVENQAINAGNETQRTQIAQQMVPFQQMGSLTNATYANPYMGNGPDYDSAAKNTYKAMQNNASVDAENMQNAANSWGQTAGKAGGK